MIPAEKLAALELSAESIQQIMEIQMAKHGGDPSKATPEQVEVLALTGALSVIFMGLQALMKELHDNRCIHYEGCKCFDKTSTH